MSILINDCLDTGSVNCCVTSPTHLRLRKEECVAYAAEVTRKLDMALEAIRHEMDECGHGQTCDRCGDGAACRLYQTYKELTT